MPLTKALQPNTFIITIVIDYRFIWNREAICLGRRGCARTLTGIRKVWRIAANAKPDLGGSESSHPLCVLSR